MKLKGFRHGLHLIIIITKCLIIVSFFCDIYIYIYKTTHTVYIDLLMQYMSIITRRNSYYIIVYNVVISIHKHCKVTLIDWIKQKTSLVFIRDKSWAACAATHACAALGNTGKHLSRPAIISADSCASATAGKAAG